MRQKIVALPRLDRLRPTIESTALKLMEEAGELAQAIGKLRGLNGETVTADTAEAMSRVVRELLDVAQTAVSMMFVLEEQYGVDIERALKEHVAKLVAKGYLTPEGEE
jgi:NTP pyrophosphatase (non-canonical NTP hydrolase)